MPTLSPVWTSILVERLTFCEAGPGVGVADAVAVAVAVGLAVAEAVALAEAVGVGVGGGSVGVADGVGGGSVGVGVGVGGGGVGVAVGVGVAQAWPIFRFAAVTLPVSTAAPSRITSVQVPLICAVVSGAKVALSEVTGAGLTCPVVPPWVER
jgi:hypothetical protein